MPDGARSAESEARVEIYVVLSKGAGFARREDTGEDVFVHAGIMRAIRGKPGSRWQCRMCRNRIHAERTPWYALWMARLADMQPHEAGDLPAHEGQIAVGIASSDGSAGAVDVAALEDGEIEVFEVQCSPAGAGGALTEVSLSFAPQMSLTLPLIEGDLRLSVDRLLSAGGAWTVPQLYHRIFGERFTGRSSHEGSKRAYSLIGSHVRGRHRKGTIYKGAIFVRDGQKSGEDWWSASLSGLRPIGSKIGRE